MPGLLSATELASIRADAAAAACDLACIIQRKIGGIWTQIGQPTVAGRSQPSEGQLANYAYLIGTLATWQVRMPTGSGLQRQDRLLIGSDTLVVQVLLTQQSYSALDTVLATELL